MKLSLFSILSSVFSLIYGILNGIYSHLQHNLRLVIFAINKYFSEFATNERYDDLCQAGMKGLITAIDRFNLKRGMRLSTYGLFWIRHSIMRSITTSSFTRYPFAFESVRIRQVCSLCVFNLCVISFGVISSGFCMRKFLSN